MKRKPPSGKKTGKEIFREAIWTFNGATRRAAIATIDGQIRRIQNQLAKQ
jgi:hypothetical protein